MARWLAAHGSDVEAVREIQGHLVSRAVSEAMHWLVLLGAERRTIVLSSNLQLRLDGIPYANSASPQDPGVAIYWNDRKLGERVIACDKWLNVYDIRACGLAVDGLRAMQRAELVANGNSARSVARAVGVSPATIERIARGESWQQPPEAP